MNDKHNILQHVEIVEENKPNQLSLGRQLIIGNEHFEDLDEILARYVQPMANFTRDIIQHKNYLSELLADDVDQPEDKTPQDKADRLKVLLSAIDTKLKELKLAEPKRLGCEYISLLYC